jgi:hypothetical protein
LSRQVRPSGPFGTKLKQRRLSSHSAGDPVAPELVDTLSHGKGNLTGLSYMAVELNGKRLDVMKELLPSVSRVTLLTNPIHLGEQSEVAESQRVAAKLNIALEYPRCGCLRISTPHFGR